MNSHFFLSQNQLEREPRTFVLDIQEIDLSLQEPKEENEYFTKDSVERQK